MAGSWHGRYLFINVFVTKLCAKFGCSRTPRMASAHKSFIVLRCMWKEPAPFLPLTHWNESCQTNWVYWGSFSVYQLKMCWYHNDDGIWYHNISGLIDQKGAFARSEDMVGCGRVSDNITKEHFLSRELFQRQDKKIFDLQHIEMFQYIKINAFIRFFLK